MRKRSEEKIVFVNGFGLGATLLLWWLGGALVVWMVAGRSPANLTELLQAIHDGVPSVQKYAAATEFKQQVLVFYCYFLVTSPLVLWAYFKFIDVRGDLSGAVKVIMWVLVVSVPLMLIVGIDIEPTDTKRFARAFNTILSGSWLGPSFVYLLYYHCLLFAVVCVVKSQRR